MLEVLTDPNGFFRRKSNAEVEFKTPLIIIAVLGIIAAINMIIIAPAILEPLYQSLDMPESAGTVIVAFIAIVAFLWNFVMWGIYSGIFYAISMPFDGEGSFKRVLEFVSYGLIPLIPSSLIGIFFSNRIYSNIDWSAIDWTSQEAQLLVQEKVLSDPSLQISGIIGILFLLWSANIWIFAMVHSRNLSVKDAAITVGVPILIYILYTLYQLRIFGV